MDEKKDGYKKIKGIGLIPVEWDVSSVGESCNIKNNLRKPISELERRKIQGKYPYYGPTKLLDYINECKIEGKNVLIGEDGDHFLKYKNQSMTLLVDGMYNVNNHAHILHGTDKCLTEWIFHFFRHRSLFSNLTRQGAGRYKLTKDALSKLSIVLPSISEQEKISKILSTWDEAIDKIEESIEEKKIIKKGLMQQLLTGNMRLKEFKEQEWKEVKLHSVLKFKKKQPLSNPEKYYLLTVKLHLKGIEATNNKPNKTKKSRPYYLREPNELLIGRQNFHNGGIGIVPTEMIGYIASNAISSLETKKGDLKFYYYYLSYDSFYKKIGHMIGGTGQKEISEAMLKKLKLIIPQSLEEQNAIANILTTADKEIALLEEKLEILKQQKKVLMQNLLTGKVRVKI